MALFGFWLGATTNACDTASTADADGGVRFNTPSHHADNAAVVEQFIEWSLAHCGLQRRDWQRETRTAYVVRNVAWTSRWNRVCAGGAAAAAGGAWPEWTFALSADVCRNLIAGLRLAAHHDDDDVIVVTSHHMRDQLVQLMLHAGYTATFTRSSGGDDEWRVRYSDEHNTEPLIRKQTDVVRAVSGYTQRTWCFDMNDGFVVVRRAVRDAQRIVTQASRPTIQGNVRLKSRIMSDVAD